MEKVYTIKDFEVIGDKEITMKCALTKNSENPDLHSYAGKWPQIVMDDNEDVYIGYTEEDERVTSIKLSYSELFKHLCLIGEAGVGKSAVFQNIMYQWAKDNYGFCYIDRKGQDVKKVLQKIPESRINDIVWIEPYSVGELSEIDIKEAVKNDKIILVKFSQIHTTETQKEIGIELIKKIWKAINERSKSTPFSLMIDEVDNFESDILETVFSEGRSEKLSLTVSTQNFHTLRRGTRDILKHNCSNVFSFRITSKDNQTKNTPRLLDIDFSELADLDTYNCISRDNTKLTTFAPYPPVRSEKDHEELI